MPVRACPRLVGSLGIGGSRRDGRITIFCGARRLPLGRRQRVCPAATARGSLSSADHWTQREPQRRIRHPSASTRNPPRLARPDPSQRSVQRPHVRIGHRGSKRRSDSEHHAGRRRTVPNFVRPRPGRRGQSHQPDVYHRTPEALRLHLRHRLQRRHRADRSAKPALRPGPDGLPDARNGRLHRHPRNPPTRSGRSTPRPLADCRSHGQRSSGRSQTLPRSRHG